MKIFGSKKIKQVLVGSLATALAVPTIMAPAMCLTSCGSNNSLNQDDIDNGISYATYTAMRDELDNLYRLKLQNIPLPGPIIEERMAEMKEKMSGFDKIVEDVRKQESLPESERKESTNYTTMTQALSERAYTLYEIRLTRNTTANWSTFQTYFDGMYQSSYRYMRSLLMSEQDIADRLNNATSQFNQLFNELQNKYFYDPLLGMTKGFPDLIKCFELCNAEIAFVSANQRLGDFLNKYTFEFKKDIPANRYDVLKNRLVMNQFIDDTLLNSIFICRNRETQGETYFEGTKSCPGYTLRPYFKGWEIDEFANIYMMKVDWTIYPNSWEYFEPEYLDNVTSHLYKGNKEIQEGGGDPSKFIETMQKSEVQYTTYEVLPSAEFEKQQLKDTYLDSNDSEYIQFKWYDNAKNPLNKWEYFYDGIKPNKNEGIMPDQSLGDSGMSITSDNWETQQTYTELLEWVKQQEEKDAQHDPEPEPEELTFVQKFGKYVNLSADVKITDANNHKASLNFRFQYKNSVEGKDGVYVNPKDKLATASVAGFGVSESFFDRANEAYATAADTVLRDYRDNSFRYIEENCHKLEGTFMASSIMTAEAIVKNVIVMIFHGVARKLVAALAIAMLGTNAAFLALGWTLYIKYLVNPINDFCKNVRIIQDIDCVQQLQWRFEDHKCWFCMKDENGNYDPNEYKTKKDWFRYKTPFDTARNLYQYYTTLPCQEDAYEFISTAKEHECDPYTFNKKFGSWLYSGECYAIMYGYIGVRMAVNKAVSTFDPESKFVLASFLLEFTVEWTVEMLIRIPLQRYMFKVDPGFLG